ncbi:hypothetical protein PO909_020045, partial [Leuciscus waleckii]
VCGLTGGSSLKPVLTGPSKAYLRSQVQFHCEVPGWASPLTFELRKDTGDLIRAEHNVKVTFRLQVTEGSEGKYYCGVTEGQTSNSIQFHVVTPVSGVSLSSDPDPPVRYEGQKFTLRCLVRKGTHLSFTWYHDQQEVNASSDHYRLSGDALTVDAASERHDGTYSCTAQNMMEDNPRYSSSRNLRVIVKKYMSTLKLSFTVFWNGSSLMANISCRLVRGSPPVTFSLLVNGLEMDVKHMDSLEFWSVWPVSLGLDTGLAQCKAQAETQQLLSDPVPLHVEGDAHVVMQNGRILFLTDISSGYYRCRARDSFNDSSIWVESEDIFIQKTDLSATPMEVIAVVFCGFLSMVIVGASCFLFWSSKRRNNSCKRCINPDEIQSDAIHRMNFPADVSFKRISVLYPRTGALDEHKLDKPVLFGPSIASEGSVVDFYCEIPGKPSSLPVDYELYVESNPGKVISEYTSLSEEIGTFPLVINSQHDGRLVCKASGHNNTEIQSSLSQGWDLKVIVPVKDVRIIAHPASNNVWEGQTLNLQCKKSKGTYVSYEWLWNERPVETPYDRTEDTLIIHRLSVQNTGNYMCVASNRFNDTTTFNSSSDGISVQVKEYVSKPELSLEVVKLEDAGFRAIITCRSLKGSPLKTFSLLNNTDIIALETSDRTSAIFHVPVELNRIMGRVRCNASNEGNWVLSEPVNLTVESVGGAVTVTPVTNTGRDFQVVSLDLLCKVERGTFPLYRWFLNSTRLEGRGGFYTVASDDSVLSLSVSPDSAGVYHCEASDSFDNTTSIRSAQMLISEELLNRVSPAAVLVVLGCFALLNVAVMVCCGYGVVLREFSMSLII